MLGGLILVTVAVVAVGAILVTSAHASLTADPVALARIGMPLGGGTVQRVDVVTGPHSQAVPVAIRNGRIVPTQPVPVGERLSVQVVVKRPGWISWLSGSTERLSLPVTAPAASLRTHFLSVSRGPLVLHFKAPITTYAYGASAGHLTARTLTTPSETVTLPRTANAGSVFVAAAPRSWESARTSVVSWFPTGGGATAVADPAPGASITAQTPVTLTFSKPVSTALGGHLPPVSPAGSGTWHTVSDHAIQFRPTGYGYGLGAHVEIPLPGGVHLIGATGPQAKWSVPAGSTTRLQQLLAILGYLPESFHYANAGGVGLSAQAQEAAAVHPPAGRFTLRFANTPAWLASAWQTGSYGELTKAAVMTFQDTNGMLVDGDAGPHVWKSLIAAAVRGQRNTAGYSVADVSMSSPESLTLWHNGHTVLSTAVNTGISQAPTAPGTFAVYEHLRTTTMSGTNPDGSHYHDPGIPFVSYFNGGDALHGFIRGSYGTPQSLGCVEMPFAVAGRVWPYTPIGTVVHVS